MVKTRNGCCYINIYYIEVEPNHTQKHDGKKLKCTYYTSTHNCARYKSQLKHQAQYWSNHDSVFKFVRYRQTLRPSISKSFECILKRPDIVPSVSSNDTRLLLYRST